MKTFLNTVECTEAVVKMGVKKANTKPSKVYALGFMAGLFVGLAYVAYITATSIPGMSPLAGKFIGSLLFPTAVILVLLAGGSLFTGNNLATLAVITGDAKLKDVMRNWIFVWLGNFSGALFLVFVCYFAKIFKSEAMIETTLHLATHKSHMTFTSALFSGFLCNVVVALEYGLHSLLQILLVRLSLHGSLSRCSHSLDSSTLLQTCSLSLWDGF